MRTIVLGLGNELLGDEGVGVHAARMLSMESLPENIKVLEVGTAILDALDDLECAERVIILDAMKADGPPGTVYKIPLDSCQASTCIASMHGFDIFRAMALVGATGIPPVTVFGVEPDEIGWSLDLSPAVHQSMFFLLQAVLQDLEVSGRMPDFHKMNLEQNQVGSSSAGSRHVLQSCSVPAESNEFNKRQALN